MSFHNYMKTVISGVKEWVNSVVPKFPSATVGQTIVVKAVDDTGRPTEWEAVAMNVLTSPSGKKFQITVDDSGTLTATEV